MSKRSRKDRLKNKFTGVELGLQDKQDQNFKYVLNSEVIEVAPSSISSLPEKGEEVSVEEKTKIVSSESKDISYLDFFLIVGGFGFRIFSYLFEVLSKYVLNPLIKDKARVMSYVQEKISEYRTNSLIVEKRQAETPVTNNIVSLEQQENNEIRENILIDTPEFQKNDFCSVEKDQVIDLSKVNLDFCEPSVFEMELRQIFQGQNINFSLNGEREEGESIETTLDFDSALYEYIYFRLDQTQLRQNMNLLTVEVVIDEKHIVHNLEFDLKVSGQKWTHIFSRNVLNTLSKRVSPYQGEVECLHIFNSTKRKEYCNLTIKHQHLDSYTNKKQVENTDKSFTRSKRVGDLAI